VGQRITTGLVDQRLDIFHGGPLVRPRYPEIATRSHAGANRAANETGFVERLFHLEGSMCDGLRLESQLCRSPFLNCLNTLVLSLVNERGIKKRMMQYLIGFVEQARETGDGVKGFSRRPAPSDVGG